MTSEWNTSSLGEIIELVIDYRGKTPKKLGSDWAATGYRALSAKNIKTGQIVQPETIRFTDDDLYKRWMKDEIHRGDILITSEAPFGEVFLWNSDEKIVLSQRIFALRCKKDFYSPFIYYYMTTKQFQGELKGRATGTTVTGLRQPELLKCAVKYPTCAEQRAIADTLSTLDARINENKKINHHLEQMVQTIYKSWFVDFEPFGGEMPEDWRTGVLSDICAYNSERVSVSALTLDTYISTENMSTGKGGFVKATSLPTISQTTAFTIGDILVSNIRPYFRKIVYCGFTGGCSTDVLCFRPNKGNLSLFVYNTLYSDNFFDYMVAGSKGTKMPRGDKQQIMNYHVVIPSDSVLDDFSSNVAPMTQQRLLLTEESARLAELRDTLLPRLMSGKIPVTNDELNND